MFSIGPRPMPNKGKLSGAWADLLPQESTKRKVIPHENKPWGCRYCKSPLIRFSTPANLRMHVSKMHPLLKKGGLRDLEPPSAREGFAVSFHSKLGSSCEGLPLKMIISGIVCGCFARTVT